MTGQAGIEADNENLSDLGRQIQAVNAAEAYCRLVARDVAPSPVRAMLAATTAAALLSHPVRNPVEATGVLAGLWLWHDELDEAHKLVQNDASPTGCFWHAIVHRRKGDYANAKFWYTQSESHPIRPSLGIWAAQLVDPLPADNDLLRLIANGWNADAWVDLVEKIEADPRDSRRGVVIVLQQLEWRLLFENCARNA